MADPLLTFLIDVVRAHYAESADPLYLSRLGQSLGEKRQALVAQFGRLADAISAAGPANLDIVGRDQPGRATVVTPEVRDAISKKIAQGEPAGGAAFEALPMPLRIAFCLKADPGQQVAVRTSAPIKYIRLGEEEALPSGFVPIEAKYRAPGLHLVTASNADKERLWRAFLSWAEEHRLDPELLNKRPAPTNALERLLAAQSPDVVARMNLPADIVAILLRHS
jgi:hypothetical protein